MIKDLANRIEVENTILPQAFTDTDTATGSTIDIVGFRRVAFAVELGALSAAGITITLQGQDTEGSWEDIAEADLVSDSALSDIETIAADADQTVHKFGLKTADYQALRANVDADTDSGAGDLAVSVLKYKKHDEPV